MQAGHQIAGAVKGQDVVKGQDMEATARSPRGWRGSPELWLEAGYAAFISGGVEAVRVMPLAERLGLSRSSFYHHFQDREALLAALVARWQGQNTANLLARTQAYAETVCEAMLNVFDCWLTPALFDSALEFAIRMWAQSAPDLTRLLAEEDAQRLEGLRAMLLRHGFDATGADTRARAVYLTQIGYIVLRSDEPTELRLSRIAAYVETFTGRTPSTAEMERFYSRHQNTTRKYLRI
jgi:AcrR family transcriptional regulator